MTKYNNILETIGNTPHVKINRLFGANRNVWIVRIPEPVSRTESLLR